MLNSNINKVLEINSNKAVLLSIKKQWLEKILSGEKTIEVRKTMPWEISYPFVVFCYETKANGGAGKVTAAFVCRDINTLDCLRELPAYAIGTEVTEKTAQFVKDSCLTANELIAYGNKSGTLYAGTFLMSNLWICRCESSALSEHHSPGCICGFLITRRSERCLFGLATCTSQTKYQLHDKNTLE